MIPLASIPMEGTYGATYAGSNCADGGPLYHILFLAVASLGDMLSMGSDWLQRKMIHVSIQHLTGELTKGCVYHKVVSVCFEYLKRRESLEASYLKQGTFYGTMKLTVSAVRTIDQFKIYQLKRVHREMGYMLFVHSVLVKRVPDLI
jgi:hypothetical protein